MRLPEIRSAVRSGRYTVSPDGGVNVGSNFQRRRLTEAITAARIYLQGDMTTAEMAISLKVSAERMAQIVRLGVRWMLTEGSIRPVEEQSPSCGKEHPTLP